MAYTFYNLPSGQKRCHKGFRLCGKTKKCHIKLRKSLSNSKRCAKGTGKCADRKCYTKSGTKKRARKSRSVARTYALRSRIVK